MEVLKSTLETMPFKLGFFFFFMLHISILGYTLGKMQLLH